MKQLDAKQCTPISGTTNNLKRIVICRVPELCCLHDMHECCQLYVCGGADVCVCVCVCARVLCMYECVVYYGCSCCIYGRTLACLRRSRECHQYTWCSNVATQLLRCVQHKPTYRSMATSTRHMPAWLTRQCSAVEPVSSVAFTSIPARHS